MESTSNKGKNMLALVKTEDFFWACDSGLIQALERLRQQEHKFKASLGLHSETSVSFIDR
jgi:hypothetical protein